MSDEYELPSGYVTHGTIDWIEDHGEPFQAGRRLQEAVGTGWLVVYDINRDEMVLLEAEGNE